MVPFCNSSQKQDWFYFDGMHKLAIVQRSGLKSYRLAYLAGIPYNIDDRLFRFLDTGVPGILIASSTSGLDTCAAPTRQSVKRPLVERSSNTSMVPYTVINRSAHSSTYTHQTSMTDSFC